MVSWPEPKLLVFNKQQELYVFKCHAMSALVSWPDDFLLSIPANGIAVENDKVTERKCFFE